MVKVDLKLLNSASNFIELGIQHFKDDNGEEDEEVRQIISSLYTTKCLLDSTIKDIEAHKNRLIINRRK